MRGETLDIVRIRNLKKYFGSGEHRVKALDGLSLSIEKGRFTVIVGASGSGKTTLLNTIGGLYRPTAGEILVDGVNLAELSEDQLTVSDAGGWDLFSGLSPDSGAYGSGEHFVSAGTG